jgi:AraC-like DNA-binding protein
MEPLQHFFTQVRFSTRHLFNDRVCGLSPTHYAGTVGYMHFFRGGKLTVIPEDAPPFTLTEPTLIFYPSSRPHHLHGDEVLGAQMLCSIVDSDTGMRRAVQTVLPSVIVIPVSDAPLLHNTLNLLIEEADAKRLGWRMACDRLFEYLIALILRTLVEKGSLDQTVLLGFGDEKLSRALTALHDDLTRDWSLSSLAEVAGMSRSSFAEQFSAMMTVTPMEYVLNTRLLAAKQLLRQGATVKAASTAQVSQARPFLRGPFVVRLGKLPWRGWEWTAPRFSKNSDYTTPCGANRACWFC